MYTRKVIVFAAISAFTSIAWPVVIVGAPSVYFGLDASLLGKLAFLFGFQVVAWVLYLSLGFIVHSHRMKDLHYYQCYAAMCEKSRGKEIGTTLEGW